MSEYADEKLRIEFPTHKVFDLIYENKWKQVKRAIFFNKSIATKCTGCCKSKCNARHSVLHYVCQFRPPLDVVKTLFKAYPNAVFEKDCKERHALHIACKHGCAPEVIKYLLEKNPEAASKADIKRRTPLLLACKNFVFESRMSWDIANNMLAEVARALTIAAPFVITDEDYKELTALEYAIENALVGACCIMQHAVTEYQHDSDRQRLENMKLEYIARHGFITIPYTIKIA